MLAPSRRITNYCVVEDLNIKHITMDSTEKTFLWFFCSNSETIIIMTMSTLAFVQLTSISTISNEVRSLQISSGFLDILECPLLTENFEEMFPLYYMHSDIFNIQSHNSALSNFSGI